MSFLQAQQLEKGNLVGVHTVTLSPNPGISTDQFINFYIIKYIPAFEATHPGWHMLLTKSIRGNVPKDKLGMIMIIDSEQTRDKYYNPDGTSSEQGKAAAEKMKALDEEAAGYGTMETNYTDWVLTSGNTPLPVHKLGRGNLFSTHCVKVNLQPGKTFDNYISAVNEKECPQLSKVDPTWHLYLLKRVRGEDPEGSIGLFYIIDTEKDRDKYFNGDDSESEAMKQASEKMSGVNELVSKIGDREESSYTDWIIL